MRPIEGYEGLYSVSRQGNVWSHPRKVRFLGGFRQLAGMWLKPYVGGDYATVSLCKNGTTKNFYIQRLVEIAYIPNPYGNRPRVRVG
jgi:hypothetical protein